MGAVDPCEHRGRRRVLRRRRGGTQRVDRTRTFVLLITGAACGAVLARLPLSRWGRLLAIGLFLIAAGLASPSVLRPSPAETPLTAANTSARRSTTTTTTTTADAGTTTTTATTTTTTTTADAGTTTTTATTTTPPTTLLNVRYLEDMEPVESFTMYLSGGPAKVNGQTYERSLVFPTMDEYDFGNSESFGYDLSRSYATFRATAGLRDDSTGDSRAKFEVLGDDRQLFSQRLSIGETAALELDVTGVLRLQLIVTRETGDKFTPVWGDARVQAPS